MKKKIFYTTYVDLGDCTWWVDKCLFKRLKYANSFWHFGHLNWLLKTSRWNSFSTDTASIFALFSKMTSLPSKWSFSDDWKRGSQRLLNSSSLMIEPSLHGCSKSKRLEMSSFSSQESLLSSKVTFSAMSSNMWTEWLFVKKTSMVFYLRK